MAFVEIKNLTFSYPASRNNALEGIHLSVEQGEICLIIGKSGSGKSTLLRLLKKEIAPSGKVDGDIHINTKNIGFVNQNVESNIVMDTVEAELAFAPQNAGKSNKDISLMIAEAASYFNLGNVFHEKTSSLSGGTKQIVSLASAFTAKADLLLLDEPISQLDPVASEEFINIVSKLNRDNGTTVIISSHRIESILPIVDKIAVMENGKLLFCGTPQETGHFLVESGNEMKAILPQYTLAFKGNPLDFSVAKSRAAEIKYKKIEEIQKNDISLLVKEMCFTYKKGLPDVLYCLDYRAEQGKINAIVGSNGCGKTTLLNILAALDKPTSGSVCLAGQELASVKESGIAAFRRDNLGFVFQDFNLLDTFSLEDNIYLPLVLAGVKHTEMEKRLTPIANRL